VGEVCGAISGAALAIGLLYGQDQPEAAHHLTREFMRQYAEQNGAVRCIDITGVDMGSAMGLLLYLVKGGKKKCNRVVGSAVQVLLDQLEDWESSKETAEDRSFGQPPGPQMLSLSSANL